MPIRNLDYECYLDATREHRGHQEDWLRLGYAPRGFHLKDFCIIQARGEWHLFHIASVPGVSCCLEGNEIWFGHATTRDFLSWQTHPPCFYIDPDGWDNGHVFAPYVIENDGAWWMFYTGCTRDNTQRIGVAVSTDLFQWRRATNRPVIRPEEYPWAFCPTEKGSACRDPHVAFIGGQHHMYYTAVTSEGRGCVARATSTDLLHWHDQGPAYTFASLNHCESSNLQQLGEKWLLFFGGHHEHWSYVVSDSPFHFPDQLPRPLAHRITAMEVIARHDSRWLVAYFKFDDLRLFLGTIDWSDPNPRITDVTTPNQLQTFPSLSV